MPPVVFSSHQLRFVDLNYETWSPISIGLLIKYSSMISQYMPFQSTTVFWDPMWSRNWSSSCSWLFRMKKYIISKIVVILRCAPSNQVSFWIETSFLQQTFEEQRNSNSSFPWWFLFFNTFCGDKHNTSPPAADWYPEWMKLTSLHFSPAKKTLYKSESQVLQVPWIKILIKHK